VEIFPQVAEIRDQFMMEQILLTVLMKAPLAVKTDQILIRVQH
jgi:hypothetical protein